LEILSSNINYQTFSQTTSLFYQSANRASTKNRSFANQINYHWA